MGIFGIRQLLDEAIILQFDGGINHRGEYDNGTEYVLGDAVEYNGSSYVAYQTTTGNLPTNGTYWYLLVEKGDKGDTGVTGAKGDTGVTGAKGDTGTTGAKGDTGTAGANGDTGVKGDTGVTGANGSNGAKGDTGTAGTKGDTGTAGVNGDTGVKGDTGTAGSVGAKGDTGTAGAKGDTGTKGDTGVAGAKGDTGADSTVEGPQGDTGIEGTQYPWLGTWVTATSYTVNDCVGYQGSGYICIEAHTSGTFATDLAADKWEILVAKGDTGVTGTTGAKGDTGTTGTTGAKGDTGTTGAKGDTGVAGSNGAKGDTGTAGAKGDTGTKGDTGIEGTQYPWLGPWVTATAYVVNDCIEHDGSGYVCIEAHTSGTFATDLAADKWQLLVAKGDKGDTGADSTVAGPKGDTGTTGSAGAKGDTGVTGTTGAKGDTGSTGAKGDTGTTGSAGAKGDTGTAGAAGDKGDTGTTGAKGDTGTKGDTGSTLALTAAPGSDHSANGVTITLVANENQNFGDVCYINVDGQAQLGDADAIATSVIVVMAIATINADASGQYLVLGIARDDTWTWTVGGKIYLSTAGTTGNTLTQTAPSGTDDAIVEVGVATHADRMIFNPTIQGIVEHTG